MRQLELLSDSLREILIIIKEKHNCPIASDLIEADELVKICKKFENYNNYSESYCICSEITEEKIHRYINNEARMLSFRFNEFAISYLPKDKETIYSDSNNKIWSRQNRVTAKPARIIQKLLVNKYTCKQYEDFSNYLKAEIINFGEFKLVSGEDIKYWYNEKNYYKIEGNLGHSCMRYPECQKFFDIYKDYAQMLIYIKDDKLIGRALVWTIEDNIYMDRVYTCFDHTFNTFIDYAKEHKWIYRSNNSLLSDGDSQKWLIPDDKYTNDHCLTTSIKVEKYYDYYPYMDSFRYFNENKNTFCCDAGEEYTHAMSSSDGDLPDRYEVYECAICDITENVEPAESPIYLHYSEYEDRWLCNDCGIYCEGLDDYISINTETVNVYYDDNCSMNYPLEYVENEDFEEIEGTWYTSSYYQKLLLNGTLKE